MINIKNGLVLYGPHMEPTHANILIEDNLIVEVSPHASGGKEIDAKGCIVSPSLINSHVHIGDSVVKDIGDGESIEKIVKPPEGLKHRLLAQAEPQELINSMRSSLQDMLDTGTSTIVDFREGGVDGVSLLGKAGEGIPLRKVILGRHEAFFKPFSSSINSEMEIRDSAMEILEHAQGIGLSGFGEINDDVVKIITSTCSSEGKLAAIHAAEYEEVQQNSVNSTGKTEVERALEADFDILIHVTSPLNLDLDLLSKTDTSVVCCPRSNGALSVGIPPMKEMWDLGINLLLGTDNLMFNSPNMFREMEYALKVTRGFYQEYFPPVEILKMATVNAGSALNLNIGCIQEGMLADIMMVEQLSDNPILSLINRTESKNIIGLMTDGNLVYLR
ncbi:amidohydrolase family protein [uncultured Methanobacterium sp.]|uniref:amidohydrolase family protein n=1 Tax=uncultured Methanobacterium sp. TaxID=176306 RepID=UPI002AA7FDB3|nr:amidohydrolase family protein [uncultured Methanobacterium sp.]